MPIGFYGLLVGICAVFTLAAGLYLLLRAQDVARAVETPDNDIESGGRPHSGPKSSAGVKIAGIVFTACSILALAVLVLVATGAIGSDETETDPTVQRP